MRSDPCLLGGWCMIHLQSREIIVRLRLELGGANLEGYFIQVTQTASFWRKLRIQYRIVTRIRCPKKVITLRFSFFFFFLN